MSQIYGGGFLTVSKPGVTLTTAAGSAATPIPVGGDGNVPRYIRVAATIESYVAIGASGVAAAANSLLVQPADAVILAVPNGVTHIAVIQGTAPGRVNVTPLENT